MIIFLILNFLFTGSADSIFVKENEITGFTNAVSITKDQKENIYILDQGANEVLKFSNELVLMKRNGKQGWKNGQFDSPTYIDASSGLDLYISDPRNYRIQRFDLDLIFIAALKTNNPSFREELQFNTPVSSVVINSNDLYVIDADNNRIVIFPNGTEPVNIFGDYRSGRGELLNPGKIMKDGNNFIYVLDKKAKAVFSYDNLGNFIRRIGLDGLITFTIFENHLHLFNGKEIFIYDIHRNTFIDKKMLDFSDVIFPATDIMVLNQNRYLLLSKNVLSSWKAKK
jgi:hypothetical protein